MTTLVGRIEEIARAKLSSEQKLQHMAEALAVRELMQELERYVTSMRHTGEAF